MRPSVFVVCLLDAFTPDLHLLLRSERQIKLIIRWVCRMYRMFRFLQKSNFLATWELKMTRRCFHMCFDFAVSLSQLLWCRRQWFRVFLYIFLTDAERQSWTVSLKSLRWNVREIQKKSLVNILLLLLSVICSQAAVVKLCQKNVTILFNCVYFGF